MGGEPPSGRDAPPFLPAHAAWRLEVGGRVQGVGFRPFVYRLAHAHRLTGWVQNRTGWVAILIQGPETALKAFATALIQEAPPLARPHLTAQSPQAPESLAGFTIHPSAGSSAAKPHLPPDFFACDDCLAEMRDPAERRYRYPFINCTQCGPRYTIIDRLPYDRPHTTMAGFPLCDACRGEYENPLDRRFHAQPLACAACGPRLTWEEVAGEGGPIEDNEAALAACVAAIAGGRVVAVKGIGGYHLLCDAANGEAVARLRRTKPRPHKPLAVMIPQQGQDGLAWARRLGKPNMAHAAMLSDPMRPIVLTPLREEAPLAPEVAPGLDEVGLMLPYSPLHHLLLHALQRPVVATSGNISGEPVIIDLAMARERLAPVAEGFLHHNRPIRRPADDAVFRVMAGAPRLIRPGRGLAPLERELPQPLAHPLLAVGGHMKSTVAVAWEGRAVLSPHIGDLESPRGVAVFREVVADLQRLHGVAAAVIVHDAHPGYAASRWALSQGLPTLAIPHHQAHASALAGEHGIGGEAGEPLLVFTWDGVGLGEDGTLWGGEALLGGPGRWRRVASLRPFPLPGGEKAAREPWRSACGVCWEAGIPWQPEGMAEDDLALLRHAWQRGLNTPRSSAAGRLFDAAAALLGVVARASFEGQGPLWLESLARQGLDDPRGMPPPVPLSRDDDGILRAGWGPLLPWLMDESRPLAARAAGFHRAMAGILLDQARPIGDDAGVTRVGLSGGVFQNRLLTELAQEQLAAAGFTVLLHREIPANDGGLAFGQVVEAAARLAANGA